LGAEESFHILEKINAEAQRRREKASYTFRMNAAFSAISLQASKNSSRETETGQWLPFPGRTIPQLWHHS
jgi:hypothetical protein